MQVWWEVVACRQAWLVVGACMVVGLALEAYKLAWLVEEACKLAWLVVEAVASCRQVSPDNSVLLADTELAWECEQHGLEESCLTGISGLGAHDVAVVHT